MAITETDMYQIRESVRKLVKEEICADYHEDDEKLRHSVRVLSDNQIVFEGRLRVIEQHVLEDMKFIKDAVSRPQVHVESQPPTKADIAVKIIGSIGMIWNAVAGSVILMVVVVMFGFGPKEVLAAIKAVL